MTPYRLLILSGCLMTLISLCISLFFVREVEAYDPDDDNDERRDRRERDAGSGRDGGDEGRRYDNRNSHSSHTGTVRKRCNYQGEEGRGKVNEEGTVSEHESLLGGESGGTSPHLTIPYHTIPYHTIPYHTLPYLTLYYLTSPYRERQRRYIAVGQPQHRISTASRGAVENSQGRRVFLQVLALPFVHRAAHGRAAGLQTFGRHLSQVSVA